MKIRSKYPFSTTNKVITFHENHISKQSQHNNEEKNVESEIVETWIKFNFKNEIYIECNVFTYDVI